MNSQYFNNQNNHDHAQSALDYEIIRDALSAKPALLQSFLNAALKQDHQQVVRELNKEPKSKLDLENPLNLAEKQYQTTLNKQAAYLFGLYKNLPVDQKIELLFYAKEIGEINDKARQQANEQMQVAREAAVIAHNEIIARQAKNAYKVNVEHNQTFKSKPQVVSAPQSYERQQNTSPRKSVMSPESNTEIVQFLMQAPTVSLPYLLTDKYSSQYKTTVIKPPPEVGLVNQVGLGSPAAVTVNLPFTHIPGIPCLNTILKKIDKTTHFDLGFTVKGMADRTPNPNGGSDIIYKLNYAGFGVMSSKFNMQISPIAIKLEDSPDNAKWGASTSIFTRQHSDGLGSKVTVNLNDSDASVSYAHEYNLQAPSKKIISTMTGGKFFGNDIPIIRIPARYVPTIDRVVAALPSEAEWGVISDRIDKVIPINQAFGVVASIASGAEKIIEYNKPHVLATMHVLKQKIAELGFTEKEQAVVLNRACEQCERNFKQDTLPISHLRAVLPAYENVNLQTLP